MEEKKEIIKIINSMAGRYSAYEVFTDWIRCAALSISNGLHMVKDSVWKEREQMYLDTARKYSPEELKMMAGMTGLLTIALENNMSDILGQVYMESGMGSKAAGQFFTPYHLSYLTANLAVPEQDDFGRYIVNEPSCGGGGMIIAAAQVLREKGINYQSKMRVVAQDLDWKGVYMCYLQLSLLGIKAKCMQADSLSDNKVPRSNILFTPAWMGVL